MTTSSRKFALCLAALLVASFAVVAQPAIQEDASGQNAPKAIRPDVGTVRGTIVYGAGRSSSVRPDGGSDVWVFAGKITLPADCTVFSSTFELTIGECATRNLSVPFLKHAEATSGGGFEVTDLPPGEYTLVIRSAHVGGTDQRDVGRKFAISWFAIKGGDTVDASTKF